jgi:hypothetical protein
LKLNNIEFQKGGKIMAHFYFGSAQFTVLHGQDGQKWLVAKELCDYLERGRDTLIRHVGWPANGMAFFSYVPRKDII